MKWRLASRGLFYDASEGSVVYYDCDSGDTHLLSEFAACILRQFDNNALGIAQLIKAVRVVGDSDPELESAVLSALDELASMHILKSL
ncbi:MAG: hypothetical protein ACI9NT_002788 [Bacteroidia bacterium]|jgi:hypothetical protein